MLDPKTSGDFDLRSLINQYVLHPPVPITLGHEKVGGDQHQAVEMPWVEHSHIELTAAEVNELGSVLGYQFNEPIQVHIIPINLTKHSPVLELKGQLLVLLGLLQ